MREAAPRGLEANAAVADAPGAGAGRLPKAVWVLTGVALALRAVALAASAGIPCLQDECSYLALANALASGRGFLPHSGHYWPPGYIVFLAVHQVLFGTPFTAKITQVALSAALVPLVYRLGFASAAAAWGRTASASAASPAAPPVVALSAPVRSGGVPPGLLSAPRVGLVAAALVAFDPTLIAYSHYVFSETLFLPLLTAGLLAVLAAVESASARRAGLAGLLLGAACLVKVVPLYLAPVLAAGIVRLAPAPPRRRVRAAAALLGVLLAVLMPWTLRNALVHGRFVLVETTAGKNLVRGNSAWPPTDWDWGARRVTPALDEAGCEQANLVDRDACFRRRGVEAIVSHPGRFLSQGVTKVADLVNPTSFLVRHLRLNVYGHMANGTVDVLVTFIALYAAIVMAAAGAGWILAPPSGARWVTGAVVLYTLAVHIVTFGMSRFRLPLAPLLAAGAAMAFVPLMGWRRGGAPPVPRARAALLAAVLAILLACWSVRVAGLYQRAGPEDIAPSLERTQRDG